MNTTNCRIIAAHKNGRSVIVENEPLKRRAFQSVKGFSFVDIWGTPPVPVVPWDGKSIVDTAGSVLPKVGGTRLLIVTFPPDSVMMAPDFDPAAAGIEYMQKLPGLAELFEQDSPGMHTTETVDYDIVLDGEIILEFDDGATVKLKAGDVVVQHGTRHAWRNLSNKPATIVSVLIGAKRLPTENC